MQMMNNNKGDMQQSTGVAQLVVSHTHTHRGPNQLRLTNLCCTMQDTAASDCTLCACLNKHPAKVRGAWGEACTQENFCTQKNFYTQRCFAEKPLHETVFAHGDFYTQKLLYTGAFTHRSRCTQNRNATSVFDTIISCERVASDVGQ